MASRVRKALVVCLVMGISVGDSGITKSMEDLKRITFYFDTITSTARENGTIFPLGEVIVEKGENQTFIFVADNCYEIDSLWKSVVFQWSGNFGCNRTKLYLYAERQLFRRSNQRTRM